MENQNNERIEEEVVENADYITAIKELKENSVPKNKYDALKEENKKLVKALVNGEEYSTGQEDSNVDIDKLRENVFIKDNPTNLQYITNVLALRDALIEEGYEDPFVPQGTQITATDADRAMAEKVASAFKEMVEIADGDPNVFLNEYQRRVKESKTQVKRK